MQKQQQKKTMQAQDMQAQDMQAQDNGHNAWTKDSNTNIQ